MKKITPSLWFDANAEEAVNYYVSLFENSRVVRTVRPVMDGPWPEGVPLSIEFELFGQPFEAINGGPQFKFTEAISLSIPCDTQEEVDRHWNRFLADGGEESMCGWLKDKYGLSWQIVPTMLHKLLTDPNEEKAARVMDAMLKMRKLDSRVLQAAYDAA